MAPHGHQELKIGCVRRGLGLPEGAHGSPEWRSPCDCSRRDGVEQSPKPPRGIIVDFSKAWEPSAETYQKGRGGGRGFVIKALEGRR